MINSLKKFLTAWIFDIRFRRACKKADKYAKTTGYKALVLMLGGKPVVKYRKVLKEEIRQKMWRANCLEILEKHALYKTY